MKKEMYYLLFAISLLSIVVVPLMIPTGGVALDSIAYFRLAYDLPHIEWSLFPLGYPVLLKIFNVIFDDFYWSSRVLNVVLYISIALFSYWKKFYFRATIILLSTKIFFFNFHQSISESLFLVCLYFLMYYLYAFFDDKKKGYRFYVPAALILVYAFCVRYSALYIYIGFSLFYLIYYYKNKKTVQFFNNDFIKFLIISCFGIVIYCFFNYFNFGDFTGEKFRNDPPVTITAEDLLRNILSVFNSFNPLFAVKLKGNGMSVMVSELVFLLINVFFIFIFVRIWKGYFHKQKADFHVLLIMTGIIYSLFLFVTQFFQGIEELNIRMLSESSFLYFFSILLICYEDIKYEKLIFSLAVFSLLFNSLYPIKHPENFLARKKRVEMKFSKMKNKKYFFNDFATVNVSATEGIPKEGIKNIEMRQKQKDGYFNGSIVMTKDPSVHWILEDVEDEESRSEVVYSSELQEKSR